ncbi:MAG TPA: sulfurtransferase TusA family protein [Anaerolineales bacterium]|nr:sulfurtransferase TusA family protein [Anaerolineales bacterium]
MASPSPDRHLDCRGLIYPAPILRAEQALREMGEGELLEVLTTDENTRPDLNAWAQRAGAEVLVVTDVVDGAYRFFVRKTRTAAAQETVERGPAPTARLFLVVLNSGFDYSPIVRSAFMYASLAAAMGFETVVYCVQAGAETMVRDRIQRMDQSRTGEPTILERYTEAVEMGVRVEVCEQTANVRGIRAEDLMEGVVLKGGAVLIDYAVRAAGQLAF